MLQNLKPVVQLQAARFTPVCHFISTITDSGLDDVDVIQWAAVE